MSSQYLYLVIQANPGLWSAQEVPKQSNGCDCGVFTCQFMESLSRDAGGFDFEQKNMP